MGLSKAERGRDTGWEVKRNQIPALSHSACRVTLQSRNGSSPDFTDGETGTDWSSNLPRVTAGRWQSRAVNLQLQSPQSSLLCLTSWKLGSDAEGPPPAPNDAGVLACCGSAQQPCGCGQARTGITEDPVIMSRFTGHFTSEHLPQGQTVRTHHSRGGVGWGEQDEQRPHSTSGTVSLRRKLRLVVETYPVTQLGRGRVWIQSRDC